MSCKTLLCLLLAAAAVLWGCAAECVATSVGADTVKASLSPGRVMTVKLLACGSTLATPPRDACDCHPDSIVVALANGSVGALVAAAAAVPGAGADPCRGGSGAGNATLTQPSCTGATQAAAAAQSGSEVTVPLVDGIGVVNISSAVPGNSTLLLNPPRGVRPAAQQPQQQQQQQQAADVSITWAHAVRVMLLPHEATRRPGEAVQATALVLDGSGQPIRGALVSFKMYGVSKLPALSSPSALTDNKGVAAVTLTGATPCSTALVAASQADGSGAAVASAPAHVTFEEPKAAAELEAEDARGESAAGVYDWGSAAR